MPRKPSSILEVRVSSPRLVWLGFCGILARLVKLGFLAAVLAAVFWVGHQGYKRVILDNPDFRLRVIDLNTNPVLDERGLVEHTGLDLTSNITRVDIAAMRRALVDHPAILDARIERHLPDTLVVRIEHREPRAWVAVPAAGMPANREPGALLIDTGSVPYPCPALQFDEAAELPVITLREDAAHPVEPGRKLRHPQLRQCMRLLDSAAAHTPELIGRIDTLEQPNDWSFRAATRCGTVATFGLREHSRQLVRLAAAINHAQDSGDAIATINLIPRENIPVTLVSDVRNPASGFASPPPRAIPVEIYAEEPDGGHTDPSERRAEDLNSLLNRR